MALLVKWVHSALHLVSTLSFDIICFSWMLQVVKTKLQSCGFQGLAKTLDRLTVLKLKFIIFKNLRFFQEFKIQKNIWNWRTISGREKIKVWIELLFLSFTERHRRSKFKLTCPLFVFLCIIWQNSLLKQSSHQCKNNAISVELVLQNSARKMLTIQFCSYEFVSTTNLDIKNSVWLPRGVKCCCWLFTAQLVQKLFLGWTEVELSRHLRRQVQKENTKSSTFEIPLVMVLCVCVLINSFEIQFTKVKIFFNFSFDYINLHCNG